MMTRRLSFGIAAVLWFLSLRPAQAVAPTPAELAEAKRWSAARFDGAERFFSFNSGGKPSAELLGGWELKRSTRELDPQRVEHTLTYSDPGTGLVVRCVGIEYRDFPATEWVLFFKNTGPRDTPILENVQALDALLPHAAGAGLIVHHARGSDSAHSDFAPLADTLAPGAELKLHSHGRRGGNRGGGPSIESLPFFNLQLGDRGVFVGLGWTGPWAAGFTRDATGTLRVQAGLERTHLLLHPGEEIRSAYCPALLMGWPMAGVPDVKDRWSKVDVDLLRKLLNEYLAIRPYLFGDFYPLMPYSLEQGTWIAWQFDVPEQGEGMVQAFRRGCGQSNDEIARFKLRGLDAGAEYVLTNLDISESQMLSGRELLDKGLAVRITEQPGSAVITYKTTR